MTIYHQPPRNLPSLTSRASRRTVSAAIGPTHASGLELAGKGVEAAERLDEMRSMGCDVVQGQYRQSPCCAEKTTKLLEAGANPSGGPQGPSLGQPFPSNGEQF